MRRFLIHPTHRKFIKLLRDCVKKDTPIILTDEDVEKYKALFVKTQKMVERHHGIYRITLEAKNRPFLSIKETSRVFVINNEMIDEIQKWFSVAERKNLRKTLYGALFMPFVRTLYKWVKPRAF